MEQSDDVEQKTSPPPESIELEQLSEDEDKLSPEILIKEKVQASPKLKNVPQISKTQSLLPTLQTTSANIEGTNKKMRQSQPSLPIPSAVSDLTTSGTKPSSAMNDLKSDYNVEELRMRLKERPSAALRMLQQSMYLDRVASVGPCVRTLNEGPSGIMIIIPKKTSRTELDLKKSFESKINRIRSTLTTLKTTKLQIVPRTASMYARVSTMFRQYWSYVFDTNETPNRTFAENDQSPEIDLNGPEIDLSEPEINLNKPKQDITIRESVIEAEINSN